MANEKVYLREAVNPADMTRDTLTLATYGKTKMPGTSDYITPYKDPRSKRWLTGLDEFAPSILSLTNAEERKAKQDAVRAEREELENLTGIDLDAKNDDHWANFLIKLKNLVLDPIQPMDRIRLRVCEANGYVAPNLQAINDPNYYKAKYYLGREHEEVSDKLKPKREYNLAATGLVTLMKDEAKARLVAKYLKINTTEDIPKDNLEELFQNYIDNKTNTLSTFITASDMKVEDLQVKVSFDEAQKRGVIRHKDGLYQRGSITYGRNEKEALSYLLLPKNSGELASVLEELEEKKKFG